MQTPILDINFKIKNKLDMKAYIYTKKIGYIIAMREYSQRINNFRDQHVVAQKKMLEEQENQVLELLKRMLPESVAYKLKNKGQGVIADSFSEVY